MNEKKDLDRLFREKFKDFEVAPPEFVWDNIQEILQEKKKRRVIPIWFKLSGVAALLILSGLLATLFFNDTDNPVNANPVVIDNNTSLPADALKASPDAVPANTATPSASGSNTTNSNSPAVNTNAVTNNGTAVATNNNNNETASPFAAGNNNLINNRRSNSNLPSANNSAVVANQNRSNATNTIRNTNNRTEISNTVTTQNADAVVYQTTQEGLNNTAAQTAGSSIITGSTTNNNTSNDAVAAAKLRNEARNFASNPNSTQNKANRNNSIPASTESEEIAAAVVNKVNKDSAKENTNSNNTSTSQGIASNENKDTQVVSTANTNGSIQQRSNAIIDKNIPVTEAVAQTTTDTTVVAQPENELEKLLQEKLNANKDDDKAVAENTPKERWVLKPQVAPVFYNSLSSGSPINEQFAANNKSYDNDLSFGLGINYAVTDRINIRSGINSVNLSYATNDISFYPSLNSATSNIGNSKTANIVVQNGSNVPDVVMIDGQPTQAVSGSMLQKTGYIEIPLEMSYSVVNKKFGIDVIGGVSSLFLNQNNVSVVSNTGLSTKVGEAQNLNNLHFSTNIGLGFKYHFWDSFQVNFEPMFKYQVNAYSENAGNFKPYFIGLYSGVSFSF